MRVGLQLFCAVALAVFVFDQVSKYWAVSELTLANSTLYGETKAEEFGDKFERFWRVEHPARGRVVEVVADFWHFRYVENPGAAFGFLSRSDSPWRTPFFFVVAVVACFVVLSLYRESKPTQVTLRLALAMILGGAIGNFVDRLRLGYVIDFIDWHWYDAYTWPTFNIADSGISVGVVLMFLRCSNKRRLKSKPQLRHRPIRPKTDESSDLRDDPFRASDETILPSLVWFPHCDGVLDLDDLRPASS